MTRPPSPRPPGNPGTSISDGFHEWPHNWWKDESDHGGRFAVFVLGWLLIAVCALAAAMFGGLALRGLWLLHPLAAVVVPLLVAYGARLIWLVTRTVE